MEAEEAGPQQVGGGLVPADQEDDEHRDHLIGGQGASGLGFCDDRHQGRGRPDPVARDQIDRVLAPGDHAGVGRGHVVDAASVGGHRSRPSPDQAGVLLLHAEHGVDDAQRQPVGEALDEIAFPLLVELRQQLVADRLDLRSHLADHPWGEGPVDDAAHSAVVGRVEPGQEERVERVHLLEEACLWRRQPLVGGRLPGSALAAAGKAGGVPEHNRDVFVAGQHGDPPVQEDGRLLTQPRVDRVGIRDGLRAGPEERVNSLCQVRGESHLPIILTTNH